MLIVLLISYISSIPTRTHFALVCVINSSIIPSLSKVKVLLWTLIWLVDVQCLGEVDKLITCFYISFKKRSCNTHFFNKMFNLRYLRFFMTYQFLSRLQRIRSRWYLFIWSGKSFLPFKLFTTYKKNLTASKITLT